MRILCCLDIVVGGEKELGIGIVSLRFHGIIQLHFQQFHEMLFGLRVVLDGGIVLCAFQHALGFVAW